MHPRILVFLRFALATRQEKRKRKKGSEKEKRKRTANEMGANFQKPLTEPDYYPRYYPKRSSGRYANANVDEYPLKQKKKSAWSSVWFWVFVLFVVYLFLNGHRQEPTILLPTHLMVLPLVPLLLWEPIGNPRRVNWISRRLWGSESAFFSRCA